MPSHPDEGVLFVDYFGRPISTGDTIVYPTCSGSGSAELAEAVVEEVVALVTPPGNWLSTGPYSCVPLVREDQLNRSNPTEYLPNTQDWRRGEIDFKRAYVLIVRSNSGYSDRADDGYSKRKHIIKNVSNVIISPKLRPLGLLPALQRSLDPLKREVMEP